MVALFLPQVRLGVVTVWSASDLAPVWPQPRVRPESLQPLLSRLARLVLFEYQRLHALSTFVRRADCVLGFRLSPVWWHTCILPPHAHYDFSRIPSLVTPP